MASLATDGYAPAAEGGLGPIWDQIRQELLRHVETRLDDPTLSLGGVRDAMSPTKYHDGLKKGFSDCLEALGRAQSFEDVFVAGRRLKLKMREAHATVEFSERAIREQHRDDGWELPMESSHVEEVISASEFHMGRRDAIAHVVSCVQEIYTI